MKKVFKAVCVYEDGSRDEATVVTNNEGKDIFQVAWEISNGEKDRSVVEAESAEAAFQQWCEENDFKPVEANV